MWVLPSGFTSAAVCSESAALVSFTRGQARHSYSPDIAGSRMGVWVGLTEPSFGLTGVSASGEPRHCVRNSREEPERLSQHLGQPPPSSPREVQCQGRGTALASATMR